MDWQEILKTMTVNGVKVTKAMLEMRLRDIGIWRASHRYLKKDALVNLVQTTVKK
jgi:hypothetical protein